MHSPTIAIIGAGNMGSSLIGGLIKNGHPADKIYASDPSQERLAYLSQTLKIHAASDNQEAVQQAQVIILAVKPQTMPEIVKTLRDDIQRKKPLLISIAAGVPTKSIDSWAGNHTAIVRAMPNTPALLGVGATALYANNHVTHEQHEMAEMILRSVGCVVWTKEESQIDIVTAVSGSGPAYFFLLMEAMTEAGIELGLAETETKQLVIQTALGAARMALEKNISLKELRQQVTSPGGTTEKALMVLEQHGFIQTIKHAIAAAKLRSEELAALYGEK